ncbi:hypothetical protein H8K38_11540 [Undibacterium sp. FT79W]|uniref:hypothetical protein n=1 Tax=Undibacterium sp. FT79W TaxID=2762296 RepID=UPI00164B8692|nr:hypothetical protein [Undibacterium sp. FT79W]MBC3878446.1 hypothetical protein [Undibacterium sp. FT79W]
MRIHAVKLRIATSEGDFGFHVRFGERLTIIRGNNSSGKSTLFLSLLYGMGMEELAGGKNDLVLPYATKTHFAYDGRNIEVLASEVLVEVSNHLNDVVTFRRAIKDNVRSPKLIEVLEGAQLSDREQPAWVRSTYLHDPGGAQKAEGFHSFFEQFIGYTLPRVPTTSGGDTKLYLQAIFAAVAIEQKRGWTDYIANIPFFGIRDARTRVVEFLLALDVFETNAERNRLNSDSVEIAVSWDSTYQELYRITSESSLSILNVPHKVSVLFETEKVVVKKRTSESEIGLPEYIGQLRTRYQQLGERANSATSGGSGEAQTALESATKELYRLTNLYETATGTITYQTASVKEYEQLYVEAKEDLARNRTALKLRELGAAVHDIELAKDRCPTCHQGVGDTLLVDVVDGPQMDLETNINYLEKQARMLERQVVGGKNAIKETQTLIRQISSQMDETRALLKSLRGDVATDASESRAIIRQQLQIELEIEKLQKTEEKVQALTQKLQLLAGRLRVNQSERVNLPKEYYSDEDKRKIRVFERLFRANAGTFEYESAPIKDIRINDETLVPFLENIELRNIELTPTKKAEQAVRKGADIKADSSASDFVRLILSYLLALHQASALPNGGGRHPGIFMLDEPGQHSMAQSSQRSLLQQIAGSASLQGIVAASFDESPEVFREVTQGIEFTLIELNGKSIVPLRTTTNHGVEPLA